MQNELVKNMLFLMKFQWNMEDMRRKTETAVSLWSYRTTEGKFNVFFSFSIFVPRVISLSR